MRASSFSNPEVIRLVSRYFVPVWLSRDDYALNKKSPAEAAEWQRIHTTAGRLGLGNGNVSVYLIDPDGTPLASLVVAKALSPDNLTAMLRKVIEEKHYPPRKPEAVQATRRPLPGQFPPRTPGGLVVHVWTRFLTGETEKGLGEDWVELTAAEWAELLPAANARPGATWSVSRKVVERLYQYCYPPLCDYNAASSKLREATLAACLAAVSAQEVRVSLRGTLELDHSRDGVNDGRVSAGLIGLVTYDPGRKVITSLRLASEQATFVWHWKGQANPSRIAIGMESAETSR